MGAAVQPAVLWACQVRRRREHNDGERAGYEQDAVDYLHTTGLGITGMIVEIRGHENLLPAQAARSRGKR